MQSSGISSPETGRHPPSPSPSTPTRKRFALTGRSQSLDSRTEAARGDLADLRLADRLFAPHYAAASTCTVATRVPLLEAVDGEIISEVLQGEDFEVLEVSGIHAWGVSPIDGAVGFVAADVLTNRKPASHIVCETDVDGLPMGSRIADPAALPSDAVRPLAAPIADFVALAEGLVGTPRLEGGRSSAGLDPAGLVFLTLSLAGIRAPRFTDLQAEALGHAVDAAAPLIRGDFIFFTDHVAIVADGTDAIHVGATAVVREAIGGLVDGGTFGPVVSRRRLP